MQLTRPQPSRLCWQSLCYAECAHDDHSPSLMPNAGALSYAQGVRTADLPARMLGKSQVLLRVQAPQECACTMQAPAQAPVTVPVLASLGQAPVSPVGGAEGHTKVWSSASKRVALIAATTQASIAPVAAPGPGPSVAAFSLPPVPVCDHPCRHERWALTIRCSAVYCSRLRWQLSVYQCIPGSPGSIMTC